MKVPSDYFLLALVIWPPGCKTAIKLSFALANMPPLYCNGHKVRERWFQWGGAMFWDG